MSETSAAPTKDAESYLLEGEEDESEVRFSFCDGVFSNLLTLDSGRFGNSRRSA